LYKLSFCPGAAEILMTDGAGTADDTDKKSNKNNKNKINFKTKGFFGEFILKRREPNATVEALFFFGKVPLVIIIAAAAVGRRRLA